MRDPVPLRTRLKVWPQYLLPQRGLTRLATAASNSRWLAPALIGGFRRLYPVRLDECTVPEAGFGRFDDFFTRALKPGARAFPADPDVIVSPCDGTLSQAGAIDSGRIIQAKGRTFTAAELLADAAAAEPFADGRFATIYLAPHDYHRVHMPFPGRLVSDARIPGRLFSVSDATGRVVDRLFARNERLVATFETGFGPAAVVLVAAMLVAGISTVWDDPADRRPRRTVRRRRFDEPRAMKRGDELGRFHWGSTVIVLTPKDAPEWLPTITPGARMRLGQALSR
ncbi:MAG: archaetidylserine decarboxylase [Candidatus Wenzhouxiangella sp. M2_3B_020]